LKREKRSGRGRLSNRKPRLRAVEEGRIVVEEREGWIDWEVPIKLNSVLDGFRGRLEDIRLAMLYKRALTLLAVDLNASEEGEKEI
jgi:hypothetical protein